LTRVAAIAFFLEVLKDFDFVGMCAEVLAILGTLVADLFFNCCDLEVVPLIRYIPRCVRYYSHYFHSKRSGISWVKRRPINSQNVLKIEEN
jgi:hypothetical protein